MSNISDKDITLTKILAKEIIEDKIKSNLKIAQKADQIYAFLVSSGIRTEVLWKKYNIILNLQDDLENAGIPVKAEIRKKWDETALVNQQKKLDDIVSFYKEKLINDCKILLEEFKK